MPTDSLDVAVGESGWTDAAARSLTTNGFVALRSSSRVAPPRDSPVAPSLCARLRADAASELAALFELAVTQGVDVMRDDFYFREVCTRAALSRRFDLNWSAALPSVPCAETAPSAAALPKAVATAVAELACAADAVVRPVLERACDDEEEGSQPPTLHMIGCVDSLPGSLHQHWHQDGWQEGLYTVFVPLCHVTAANGPTELRPGSHVYEGGGGDVWDVGGRTMPAGDPRVASVQPQLREGEVLIFDFRVFHRGTANRSAEPRPLMYLVYSTKAGVRDHHNFLRKWKELRPSGEVKDASGGVEEVVVQTRM